MGLKPLINFSSGEASPKLSGRADTVPYNTAAETLDNVLVTKYGSVYKTAGTRHVSQGKDSSTTKILRPFIFSTGQSYVLEFGNLYMRVFQGDGSLVESSFAISAITQANPCVVTTATHSYSDGDYVDISGIVGMTELNGKRFIVANKTATTFELTDEDGAPVNSTSFTAYSSAGISERIYEITTPFETADLPNLKFTQQADVMFIASSAKPMQKLSRLTASTFSIADIVYDTTVYPPFEAINVTSTTLTPSATTGTGITVTASTAIFDTTNHVGSYWKITTSGTTGYVKFTAVGSTTVATADVIVTLGGTGAVTDWHEGSWSLQQGHPIDVKFNQNRLEALGTTLNPLTVWASVIEEYENFNNNVTGTITDSDSYRYTLTAAKVDRIYWGYPTNVMNLGTAAGPFTVDASSALEISQARLQNEDGAADVDPVRIGPFVYYVERSGTTMGEFSFNFDNDAFQTKDITYLNDHILSSGVKEMSLQKYPDTVLWAVLNNGTIATMTREIEQNIKGWTRQTLSGTDVEVESIATIPNGAEDRVWVLVKRTINSITRRYIEYFETTNKTDQEDEFYVQSGLTYDSTPATVFTNLNHLEGETVSILADGAVLPDQVVTGGAITLTNSASVVQIGLGYTATIKSLDVEMASESGSAQTRFKHIGKVFVRFLNTLGAKVGNGTTQNVIPFRTSPVNMGSAPDRFTGDKQVTFPSGWDRNKQVVVTQEQPLPLHVLGIYLNMKVS